MRAIVDANAKPVSELTAEPGRDEREQHAEERERQRAAARCRRIAAAQKPADGEQEHDDDVANSMKCADALRSCVSGNAEPIDESEDGRGESPNDSHGNHVKRSVGPRPMFRKQVDDVEQHSRCEQAERKDDEHLMNRMTEELCSTLHRGPPWA